MVFLQLFLNGLQLGAIYALTAVGFSLIFGSTKIFHVAHGSAFAIGGFFLLGGFPELHLPGVVAAPGGGRAAGRVWPVVGGGILPPGRLPCGRALSVMSRAVR